MKIIWYLLKCPAEREADYVSACQKLARRKGIQEVICFQYQRMLRYKGSWHLEERTLLPGYIFLWEPKTIRHVEKTGEKVGGIAAKGMFPSSVIPCKVSCLKELCSQGNLIGMSQGMIRNGTPVVTQGPLKGREHLIRKIDRHKRTAQIQIPIAGQMEQMIVGLEIYEKQL